MKELELQLENQYPQFRRIWVQYSNYRGYRMCITLFPHGHDKYQMIIGSINQLNFENVNLLIQEYLEKSK